MTASRILMVANAEWYFISHDLAIAKALQTRGHEVVVAAGVERGRDAEIRAAGLRFVPVNMLRGRFAPQRELTTGIELARLYRAERPDLIYQTTIKPILYGSMAARVAGTTRIVNAIPGLGHVFSSTGAGAAVRRWAVELAYGVALAGRRTRVVFQNDDDRQLFVDRKLVPAARTVVIRGSGVDLRQFVHHPEPAGDGAPIVLLASRLLWDKGVGQLVDAARRLREMKIACRMVIVGIPDPGNPNAVPAATLEEWQRDGLVEWWGLRSDMPDVLRRAAIVALPSHYAEGVPRILLEAAAAGRPVVTTDTPGCRDAVRAGVSGLLVPPRDVNALTEALASLLRAPRCRPAMGLQGRALAEEQFGEELVTGQMVQLCEELLEDA
ncbi:MAG TPA: glycosyltransferase family 4 protein [Gemmatimonadaceae bacterium]|nr:glycosyltransferase family 4 protein [Gemmatimonadaceae bacterium]